MSVCTSRASAHGMEDKDAGPDHRRCVRPRRTRAAAGTMRRMLNRRELIEHAMRGVEAWEARWGAVPDASALAPATDIAELLETYAVRMDAMLPFFHPRYA